MKTIKVKSVKRVVSEIPECVYDIGVSDNHNYFVSEGEKFVLVHNCHRANSTEFSKIVSRWPSKIKIGVTATDKRKDGRHFLIKELIGPVAARVEIPQLRAKIYVHNMDFVKSASAYRGPAGFVYATRFLSKHERRNEAILDFVMRDLKKGHCIVIPTLYRDHVTELVGMINEEVGERVAEAFVGGAAKKNKEIRERIIENARNRKIRVVVGIRSLLQLGLNVPSWSAIYYIMPMSNEPNWKQESSRILTPDNSGLKKQPIIRMFVDPNIGLSMGCFANTYKQSLKFKHIPSPKSEIIAAQVIGKHVKKHKAHRVFNASDPYAR